MNTFSLPLSLTQKPAVFHNFFEQFNKTSVSHQKFPLANIRLDVHTPAGTCVYVCVCLCEKSSSKCVCATLHMNICLRAYTHSFIHTHIHIHLRALTGDFYEDGLDDLAQEDQQPMVQLNIHGEREILPTQIRYACV
jgi:hypothetical protein